MSTTCDCCHAAEATAAGLCDKCAFHLVTIQDLAPSYKLHVLAAALDHSVKDICRILGKAPSAHGSALSNAVRVSGVARGDLIKTARWGLAHGYLQRPAGFEDLGPENGPESVEPRMRSFTTYSDVGGPQRVPARPALSSHEMVRGALAEVMDYEDGALEPAYEAVDLGADITSQGGTSSISATVDCTPDDDRRLEAEFYRGLALGLMRGLEALERVR